MRQAGALAPGAQLGTGALRTGPAKTRAQFRRSPPTLILCEGRHWRAGAVADRLVTNCDAVNGALGRNRSALFVSEG